MHLYIASLGGIHIILKLLPFCERQGMMCTTSAIRLQVIPAFIGRM